MQCGVSCGTNRSASPVSMESPPSSPTIDVTTGNTTDDPTVQDSDYTVLLRALQQSLADRDPTLHLAWLPTTREECFMLLGKAPQGEEEFFWQKWEHIPAGLLPARIGVVVSNTVRRMIASTHLVKDKKSLKITLSRMMSGVWLDHPVEGGWTCDPTMLALLQRGITHLDPPRTFGYKWDTGFRHVTVETTPWYFQPHAAPDTGGPAGWDPIRGRAVGTCFRELDGESSLQLFNAYTQTHSIWRRVAGSPSPSAASTPGGGSPPPPPLPSSFRACPPTQIIRHAVMNSSARCDMFFSLLTEQSLSHGWNRIRMLSLLTRFADKGEELQWQQQKALAQQLAGRLWDARGISLVHLGLQFNANTKFNFWNHGEDANAVRNSSAWLQYTLWVLEDAVKELREPSWTQTLQGLIRAVEGVLRDNVELCSEVPFGRMWFSRKGWFNTDKNPVYKQLRDVSVRLPALAEELGRSDVELSDVGGATIPPDQQQQQPQQQGQSTNRESRRRKVYRATRLLGCLLQSQYPPIGGGGDGKKTEPSGAAAPTKEKTVPRLNEVLCLAMLDQYLGVSSCMNCKSGCDRAGLAHALTTSVAVLLEAYPDHHDTIMTVCCEFDTLRHQVDYHHTATFDQYLENLHSWWPDKGQPGPITDDPGVVLGMLAALRNNVLMTMLQVGWKVNIYSTGLNGLKYHMGNLGKANPHVTAALPPFVIGKYDDEWIAAEEGDADDCPRPPGMHPIRVHESGTMDKRFAAFLNGASEYRGA